MNNKTWFGIVTGTVAVALLGIFAIANVDAVSADAGVTSEASVVLTTADGTDIERGRGRNRGPRIDRGAFLAEALGVTEDELSDAMDAVRTAISESDELTRQDGKALLAAELNITEAELEAAMDEAKAAAIANAVEEGDITQEQADLLTARSALKDAIDKDELLAGVLGVTVDEIEAAKGDREARAALIEGSGLTREEISTGLQEAYDAAVAQAVEDGIITQEQADLLEEAQNNRRNFGRGGNRGPGGGNGNGNGGNGVETANEA